MVPRPRAPVSSHPVASLAHIATVCTDRQVPSGANSRRYRRQRPQRVAVRLADQVRSVVAWHGGLCGTEFCARTRFNQRLISIHALDDSRTMSPVLAAASSMKADSEELQLFGARFLTSMKALTRVALFRAVRARGLTLLNRLTPRARTARKSATLVSAFIDVRNRAPKSCNSSESPPPPSSTTLLRRPGDIVRLSSRAWMLIKR